MFIILASTVYIKIFTFATSITLGLVGASVDGSTVAGTGFPQGPRIHFIFT